MPFSHSLYNQELLSIMEKVKKYTKHDIIGRYIDIVPISSLRLHLMYLMLKQSVLSNQLANLAGLSVSLVQIGLDLHDEVDSKPLFTLDETRQRQMQVLAGDYLSSRYYLLLSEAGETELLGLLSQAICEINETKMTYAEQIRQNKPETLKDMMLHRRSILFDALAQHYLLENKAVWRELHRLFIFCEWVHDELIQLQWDSDLKPGLAYWYMLEKTTAEEKVFLLDAEYKVKRKSLLLKYSAVSYLHGLLEQSLQSIVHLQSKITNDAAKQELSLLAQPFVNYFSERHLVEEM